MKILPNSGSSLRRPRHRRKEKRQELIGATPTPDDPQDDVVAIPPQTRTSRQTITVINGNTVVEPGQTGPPPGSPTSTVAAEPTSPTTSEASSPSTSRGRPDVTEPTEAEVDDLDIEPASSTASLTSSPPTGKITFSSSPNLDESTETNTRTRGKSEKTTSATKTKPNSPTNHAEKKQDANGNDRKSTSATTWVAIAAGVVGGLLLLMAVSAYYRRWRRKRKEGIQEEKDNESFVTTKEVDLHQVDAPPNAPDWANEPMRQARQIAEQTQSGRGSLLPEPGSEPRPEDEAPWRREPYPVDAMPLNGPSAVPRRNVRNEPTVIETSGDSRLFSRPVSEVVLNGQSDQNGDQYYDYGATYAPPNVRRNSYASSGYEALDDPRRTMLDYRYQ